MNKTEIMNQVSRTFNKVGFQLKQHSPEILVVAGVVGTVASAVMACKATLKVNDVLEEPKQTIEKIHIAVENGETEAGLPYNVEDSKKDLAIVYVQTGVKLAKLYAPAIAVGALSIAGILKSNNILKKRNVALAAAYTAVDKSFKEYRSRVVERFGEELDKELKYNIKAKEVEEIVVDEYGNEKVEKTTVMVANPGKSEFAVCFDETCEGWTRDAEANKRFLIAQQNYLNQKLQTRGYVLLNEVYEALGFQKTKAGHVVGWVYDEEHPNGDNFIDFFMFDLYDENKRAFANGYEKSIWLDFNVDGNVYDLIRWKEGL
jgi:hypothetical protein